LADVPKNNPLFCEKSNGPTGVGVISSVWELSILSNDIRAEILRVTLGLLDA